MRAPFEMSYFLAFGFIGICIFIGVFLRAKIKFLQNFLVPACIFGGGAYLVICDTLARVLPQQGEMPAGVVTALIGAPLFIYLMKRSESQ